MNAIEKRIKDLNNKELVNCILEICTNEDKHASTVCDYLQDEAFLRFNEKQLTSLYEKINEKQDIAWA